MDKLQQLLDQLASVLAEMQAITTDEAKEASAEGDAPAMSDEQAASLRSLEEKADKLRERIEFVKRVQEKELELRAVLERGAPAKAVEKTVTPEESPVVAEKRTYAIPRATRNLKAFTGPNAEERAYRAGMSIKGFLLGDEEARRWCYDHGVESRAQAGGINSLGGVLTNPELSAEVIRLVEEYGAFPANAKSVVMNSDTLLYARRTGGLSAKPIGENAAPTSTNVTFDNVQLVAKLWGVDNRIPMSLMEDSVIDIADLLALEIAQAYAEAFDNAAFIGSGAGDPYHGTVGLATAIVDGTHSKSVVTASAGQTFSALTLTDFTNLVARLPVFARRNAKFYISPAGYGSSMLRLMVASSGNRVADVAAGADMQFLGFPVVMTQPLVSDLTGTNGQVACLFGDLSQSSIYGVRRDISVKTDASRFVEYDQLLTFATARVSLVNANLGSTDKAGPVVALKFAS